MEYIPIRIGTIRPGAKVAFDVFIPVGSKHVHYIHKDDAFEADRIQKLRDKGLKKVFIPEECEDDYLNYLDQGLDELQGGDQPIEARGEVAHDSMVTSAENAERNFESEQGYRRTEGQVEKVAAFLSNQKGALNAILKSAGVAQDASQHSANVASLSLALAPLLGVSSEKDINELGLAALVHDIGHQKLSFDPRTKKKEDFTKEEMKEYWKHPVAAADLLSGKKYITPAILRLIAQHEEKGENMGFPEKRNLERLPITSQILALCNEFDRFCMEKEMPPLDAMSAFFNEKADLFNMEHMTKLGEVIQGKI